MDITTTRRQKLREVIDSQYGGSLKAFVDKTGINPSELSGLLRTKSFGEKKARHIERMAALPPMYLDTPSEVSLLVQQIFHLVLSLPEREQEMVLAFCQMAAKNLTKDIEQTKNEIRDTHPPPPPLPPDPDPPARVPDKRVDERRTAARPYFPERRKPIERRILPP